eukprot:14094468-Alexandrium_andersonii.AAC.1
MAPLSAAASRSGKPCWDRSLVHAAGPFLCEQQRAVLQVLVTRLALKVQWPGKPLVVVELALPPMYVSSVGSEAVWSLLFGHPFFRAVMDAKHALELSAGIVVEL